MQSTVLFDLQSSVRMLRWRSARAHRGSLRADSSEQSADHRPFARRRGTLGKVAGEPIRRLSRGEGQVPRRHDTREQDPLRDAAEHEGTRDASPQPTDADRADAGHRAAPDTTDEERMAAVTGGPVG